MTGRSARAQAVVVIALLARLAVAYADAETQAPACIRASDEAIARRKAGELLQARASLSACASPACPAVVRASCAQRLAETNQAIPTIAFLTRDDEGHDLASVKVTVDDGAYAGFPGGAALSLDPGAHVFRFDAPGRPPVVLQFVLLEGDQRRRETIVISAPERGSAQRTLGLAVGGAGVAGLVAGGVFGVLSIQAHDAYERQCGGSIGAPAGECTAAGVSGQRDAAMKGTVSTASFLVGGGALAAGALLFFLAPRARSGVDVAVGPGGLAVSGRF